MSAADSAGARRVGAGRLRSPAVNTPDARLREEAVLDPTYIAVKHSVLLSAYPG